VCLFLPWACAELCDLLGPGLVFAHSSVLSDRLQSQVCCVLLQSQVCCVSRKRPCSRGLSEDEVVAILSKRVFSGGGLIDETFFQLPEVREVFEESDLKHIDTYIGDCVSEAMKNYKSGLEKYTKEIAANRAPRNAVKPAKKAKAQKPQRAPTSSTSTRPLRPSPVDADLLPLEQAETMVPTGTIVYKSRHDNRWKLSLKPHGGISRCWTAYGEHLAFYKCANYIWEAHAKSGGPVCPHREILDADWRIR